MVRRLLIRVGDPQQQRLRPGAPVNRHSHRQQTAASVSHRDVDRRESGGGGEELAVVAGRRVQVADQARRIAPRGIDKGIQLEPVHGLRHGLADLLSIRLVGLAGG
jgi:hypothetical protein